LLKAPSLGFNLGVPPPTPLLPEEDPPLDPVEAAAGTAGAAAASSASVIFNQDLKFIFTKYIFYLELSYAF
jgi:hypothetical protein